MGPIQVVVEDGNNLVLEVTPTPSTTVIIDRGIAGPPGPMGDGDVDGPASSTDNAIARFDGTTGKLIQNSNVTIDDGGNLGVGVTPSTWSSQIRAMQVYGGTSYWAYNFAGIQIGGVYFNAYNDGVAKYSNTNRAASFEWGTNDGAFKWLQAASGTANNAISFTQAMTLSANGNRQLGGTNSRTISGFTFDSIIGSSGAFTDYYSGVNRIGSVGCESTFFNIATGGSFPITFDTNGIERMRIDASGNVGIGTSSPNARLDVTGTAAISGAVTLSGGTANGVAYLNGSKVLTTGSALTFDGTRLAVNGGANGSQFSVKGTSAFVGFDTGAANDGRIEFAYNGTKIFEQEITSASLMTLKAVSGVSLSFGANNAEQMRLTSTGLGIGTSSPGTKLEVDGRVQAKSSSDVNLAFVLNNTASGGREWQMIGSATGGLDGGGTFNLRDNTAGANRLTVDSSGNLGLGVTPSAWDNRRALQVGAAALAASDANRTVVELSANSYLSTGGSFRYLYSTDASLYQQASGRHAWFTAPSGTAGNAISFTQAMTLTAAGRLGVGTTAPQQTLHAYGNIEFGGTSTPFLYSHRNAVISGAVSLGNIEFAGDTATTSLCLSASIRAFADGAWTDSSYPSNLRFLTTSSGSTDPTERMRLSSDGNLGLGVTPSAWGSAYKALDINTRGFSFAGGTESGAISVNAYWNSGWKYAGTSTYRVTRYDQFDGSHFWYTAPSGTAGNAISFTQAMTLDAAGRLLLGTTSDFGGATLQIAKANSTGLDGNIRVSNNVDTSMMLSTVAANVSGIYSSGAIAFGTGSNTFTERARIDSSGNLGIGTTIPASYGRLAVNGTASILTNGAARFYNSANNNWSYIDNPSTDGTAFLRFATGGGEAMRLSSDGNLGLGVTPSAWSASGLIDFSGNGVVGGSASGLSSNALWLGCNFYYGSGAYRYKTTNSAGLYQIGGTEHRWFTAPSGTANNAISFTQAMTLTASGNLLVGTSVDNGYRLALNYTSGPYVTDFFNSNTSTNQYNVSLWRQAASGSAIGYVGTGGSAVGNTSFANNFVVGTQTSSPLVFNTGDTERARIDSSGNLLVGTTTASGRVTVVQNSASSTIANFQNTENSPTAVGLTVNFSSATGTNNTTAILIQGRSAGAERFYVYGNGNVVNTNNSYGAISDAKLKENIVDATPKLEKLNQVRVVNFNMIGSEQKQIGVIAQELEAVFPAMVEESPDRDTEGNDLGTTTKSVKYSVFVPMLIKAIQEQQAIINQLKARLDAANI